MSSCEILHECRRGARLRRQAACCAFRFAGEKVLWLTAVPLFVLLASCSSPGAPTVASTDVISTTISPDSPLSSPAPSQQLNRWQLPSPTTPLFPSRLDKDSASATAVAACLAAGGRVEEYQIDSEFYEAGLQFRVYTPPCYGQSVDQHYPVLYLIHGQGFTDDQWDRIDADEAADRLIGVGEVAPFIIIMPYDNYSLRPSVGLFDEAFIEELIPWVDEHLRTIADRRHRAIGGLSRGASWAMHFALTRPDLFGAMGGHSPPVFIEEAKKVVEWLDAISDELMPRFWLDIGDSDTENIMHSAAFFEGLLLERQIPHEWHVYTGDHSEEYWSAHVEEYLRWYAADW